MPYLGNEPAVAYTSTTKDSFSGDGSTTDFTMSKSANVNAVRVVVENVVQNPTVAYTCSGTTISFTSAPPTGTSNIYVVHLGPPAATIAPPTTINNSTTFGDGADIITGSKGTDNVRLGENAGNSIESGGNQNTLVGNNAGAAVTTGDFNVAVGSSALAVNTTANQNVAVGRLAMQANTTGASNTGLGDVALYGNISGSFNTAVGENALQGNTTGSSNTGLGRQALSTNTTGYDNTAVGYTALNGVTTGYSNTSIGKGAGSSITTGAANTIVGRYDGNQGSLDIRTASNYIVLSDGAGNPELVINPNGYLKVGPVGASSGITTSKHEISQDLGNNTALQINHSSTSTPYGCQIYFSESAPNNTTNTFLNFIDNSGLKFRVFSNGNVQNANNSYGSTSDQKLKENIADASSQWDDIKALTIRKYSLKEESLDAANQLGVIAQELETSGMSGLVYETPDKDSDNKDIGTTTKGVKYSILYMKAVKALQEAMTRIETLETKVAALEAG